MLKTAIEAALRAGRMIAERYPGERRVTMKVSLKMTDQNNKIIWSAREVSDNEAYDVETNKQATEENRRLALNDLSSRMAERIYNRLVEDF